MNLDIKKSALLVVDIQNDFCSSDGKIAKANKDVSWLQKTVEKMSVFIEEARTLGLPVFFIRFFTEPDAKLSPFEEVKEKKRGISALCTRGTSGANFYKLIPGKNDKIIDKHGYSAFFGTDLHEQLSSQGIQNLLVIGTSTHLCVDSTVRDAFQYGFTVYVLEDLVATRVEQKNLHDDALQIMAVHFAYVIPSKKALELLK